MKNFSLKALGAFIFAAGLVVAGVASPALATATVSVASGTTLPTFQVGSSSPAFSITIDNGAAFSSEMTEIWISSNGTSWFIKNTCANSGTAYASSQCGISSIAAAPGATGTIGSPMALRAMDHTGGLRLTALGSVTAITISFAEGAWSPAANSGTYSLKATTGGVDSSMSITLNPAPPPPSHTITFNANGGSGTMANQTASGNQQLSRNTFTKTGTTFRGWSTTCNGQLRAMDQEPYSFFSDATLYAVWADSSNACNSGGGGGGNAASANLSLNATTGQLIAGSTVGVSASGLQSTAAYTVTVQSTPQTIGSGNATSGAVSTTVTLPSGLEAGWHTLTFTSTSSTGSAVESKYYFKISASGTLLSTSSTIPAELANTGVDSTSAILLLAGGLSLALIGAEMFMIARRKRSN